jgi:hypothetical protein
MPEATICGLKVQIDEPYAAGARTLTEGEAHTLNQARREGIRNNLANKVKDILGETKAEAATDEQKSKVQALVNEYAGTYEFGVRGVGSPRITDPVESAAKAIARSHLINTLKSQGRSTKLKEYKSPSGQTADEKIAELMQNPQVQKLAKEQVAAMQKIAEKAKGIDMGEGEAAAA